MTLAKWVLLCGFQVPSDELGQQEDGSTRSLPTLTRVMPSSRTGYKDVLGSFFAHLAPGHALLKHPQHVYAMLQNGQFDSLLTSVLTFIFTLALFNERGPSSCGLPLLHTPLALSASVTLASLLILVTLDTLQPQSCFLSLRHSCPRYLQSLIPHPSGLCSNVPYR